MKHEQQERFAEERKGNARVRRVAPVVVALLASAAVLLPSAVTNPYFMDENLYLWSGTYFSGKLARFDFGADGAGNSRTDPTWNPDNWWSLTAPVGFSVLYGSVLGVAGLPSPARPFDWNRRDQPQPDASIRPEALLMSRMVAVLCSAVGLAMLAVRFGWIGTLAALVMLVLPGMRENLSMVLAEPPLILALGLLVVAYGSRWLPLTCALAASCKLSALGFWFLLFLPGATGRTKRAQVLGVPVALLIWTLINPASWFAGGPLYLMRMLAFRQQEYADQAALLAPAGGVYLPSRYFVPLLFGLMVAVTALLPRTVWWQWARARGRST